MGLAMAVGPLVGIMAGVPAGHLVDRFGPIPVTLAGMALVPIASIGFATVPAIVGVAGFIIFAVTLTPGNQLFMAANITEVIARAGQEHQGAASGLLNLARNLGFVIGTPLLGLVYEAAAARARPGRCHPRPPRDLRAFRPGRVHRLADRLGDLPRPPA